MATAKIVPLFHDQQTNPEAGLVTQAQLIRLNVLKLNARLAVANYQQFREFIEQSLDAGAQIEEGCHTVSFTRRMIVA